MWQVRPADHNSPFLVLKIYELGISSPLSPDITGGLKGMHYKLSSFNCEQAGALPFSSFTNKLIFQELVRHEVKQLLTNMTTF